MYVAIAKILNKINKKYKMQEILSRKKEFIIVVYHKKDAIVKNRFAKKNIVSALILVFYAHKLVNA